MENNQIIFKAVVGSQAYGTNTKNSDEDIKGIYIQPAIEHCIGLYKEIYEASKDESYFEIRRFIELAAKANPTILELLFSDKEWIIYSHPVFDILKNQKEIFLTKLCRKSFAEYAIMQIKKAKGLNKKINWEESAMTKKSLFDFIYVSSQGKTYPVLEWLASNNMVQEKCSLVALNHFKDCYALFYDVGECRGILKKDSQDLKTSSVPKGVLPLCDIHFNRDGYKAYNKKYKEYEHWLRTRNIQRYVDVQAHNQSGISGKYDGKNLLHCRRLIDVAIEIAQEGTINVKRKNVDELLDIKYGRVPLDTIIKKAEEDILKLDELYSKSNLPNVFDTKLIPDLITTIRDEFYSN